MIRDRAQGPIEDVEYRGEAMPAPEAVAALQDADTIIIGPSNPVLSIDPILSVLAARTARRQGARRRGLAAGARRRPEGADGRLPALGAAGRWTPTGSSTTTRA